MPPLAKKTITITCATPDAEIHYEYSDYGTPDECPEPTIDSPLYEAPIVKEGNEASDTYIKAKAFKAGMTPSDTAGSSVFDFGHS